MFDFFFKKKKSATRVAGHADALVGIARVSVTTHRGFLRGCARHLHVPSHLRKRRRGALVLGTSCILISFGVCGR